MPLTSSEIARIEGCPYKRTFKVTTRPVRTCPECGETFDAHHGRQRFCLPAHKAAFEQRNRDRAELERTISDNVETMVLPMLGRLGKPLTGTPESIYLAAATQALREVVSPFAQALSPAVESGAQLTPREREIAGLIRVGCSSSEIAEALYISPTTVAFHRKNLRRKLGLAAHGPRLASHLGRNTG